MAKEIELNIFELMKDWFDFCYENPELINANHTALYFFVLSHSNRLGWKQKFGLPKQMAMDALGIRNYRTYKKAFDDIVNWGFLKLLQKSENQYSANIVGLVKNTKSTTKSLSKATLNHSLNHVQTTAHIIKPITNIPNTERVEITPENSFDNLYIIPIDLLEKYMLSDEKWIEDIARINKLGLTYESSISRAKEWISLFIEKLRADNVKEWQKNDCFRYCNNWMRVELEKIKKNGNKKSSGLSSEEEQREFLNAVASGIARAEHERNIAV